MNREAPATHPARPRTVEIIRAPHAQRSVLPHFLAALYALSIVYASLQPFSPWIAPPPGTPFFLFLAAKPLRNDIIVNVLAYVPFGFFIGLSPRQARPARRFALALLAGAALSALVAVPLGLPVLRLRGIFLAIATIGFGEVVRIALVNWEFVNGAQGLVAIPQKASVGLIWAALLASLLLLSRLRGSKWGFALEAIRQDEPAARTMGIDTAGYKLAMLVVGAALAGLAGGLEAHFTFMVAPNGFTFSRVVDMLVFAVVGGVGVAWGPAVGAAFLTILPEVLREVSPLLGIEPGPLRLLVNGLILLSVILFLPQGLMSLPAWWRERRERRDARTPA